LELYDENDGGAAQMAATLPKMRERISALHAQREDIDGALVALEAGVARLEAKLAAIRPDLLPQAEDYAHVLRAGLGDAHPHD
jgi:septal ring factor EnvC (AmiA/AmiB activator)